MSQQAKVEEILALTDKPYDEYNTVLAQIKSKLKTFDVVGYKRVETFEQVLSEELPEQTARRAFRIAALVALGEEVQRETKKPNKHTRPV
jgi:hypothetical protein